MKLFAQVTKPENGYLQDQEAAARLIAENGTEYLYEVDSVEIGRSSTKVHIVDRSYPYNSVNFTFFISIAGQQVKTYDIFENKEHLRQIFSNYVHW